MPTLLEISNQVGAQYKKKKTLLESSSTQKPQSNIQKTFGQSMVPKKTVTTTPTKNTGAFKQAVGMGVDDTFQKGKEIGKWFLNLSKNILQAGPRAMASSALPVAGSLFGDDKPTFTPKTGLEKAVFGNEPIKGMFQNYMEGRQSVEKVAGNNPVLKGAGAAITPFAVAGLMLADLTPITGLSENTVKNVSKEIAESKTAVNIVKSLSKIFKSETDDVLKPLASELVDVTDKKVVKNFLDELVRDTKKTGGISRTLGATDNVAIGAENIGKKIVNAGDEVIPKLDEVVDNATDLVKNTGTKAKKIIYDTPSQVEKKVVAQVFRGDKLNLDPSQLKELESRLNILGLTERTVQTHDELKFAAQELGTDIKRLLEDTKTSRITGEEVVTLRNIIKNQSDFIVQANEQLKNTALKADEIKKIKSKIEVAENTIDIALGKVTRGGTEAGRAVAAFKIMANKTMDPVFWLEKAKKVSGKDSITGEVHDAILDLISKKDTLGLAQFISMQRNPSFSEKAITLWKAGLLTSPTTHAANILGNTSMRILLDATDLVKLPLDTLISLATRKRTTIANPSLIVAKVRGLVKGVKKGRNYLKDGMYDDDFIKKWDIPRMVNFRNKLLNGYTQTVFRTLGAEDALFRSIAMEEAMEKQAMLIVKNEGLKGAQAVDRVRQLLIEPTNGMIAEAIDIAEYATFQGKNVLNDLIIGAKRAVKGKPLAETGVEFVAPFSKTPTNVAARIADFSPLGFVKAFVNVARPSTRSQKAFVDDISRAITGTSMIAFGAYLAKKGLMTGSLPQDKQERDDFLASNKQANSIYLFGQWRQLNRISPVGNLLALGASFEKLSQDKSGLDLMASTAATGLKSLTEQTFLKGVSGGLSAINDPDRNASKYIEQTVASIVPTGISKIAKTLDPTLRDPDGIWQTIQNRLPFISDELPVTRDVFGHAVRVSGGRISIVDPFGSKKPNDYPALKEAGRVGITIGKPEQTLKGTKLTNKEYSIYQKINGNLLEKTLNNVIESDGYKSASDENKGKIIEKVISKVREKVNEITYPQIIATRYNLPENINPTIITKIMTSLNKIDGFKELSEEEKEGKVKEILTKVQR